MSNKLFKNRQYTLEQDIVTLFGSITVGASGAVSAIAGGGIKSVVKESADGQYTIELDAKYSRLLDFSASVMDDAISNIIKVQVLEDPAAIQADFRADSKFVIQLVVVGTAPALAAANAASGAVINFKVVVRNSSVGPFDR